MHDVNDLYTYWRKTPPAHVSIAIMAHTMKTEEAARPPSSQEEIAAFFAAMPRNG